MVTNGQIACLSANFFLGYISARFSPNVNNVETPLIKAVQTGTIEMVEYLLAHGSNMSEHDKSNSTPLMFAARASRLDMIKYLISHGINVNAQNDGGATAITFALKNNRQDIIDVLHTAGEVK